MAALCYSCSISCHGDHELVEIFDKRGVRCDCGTGRLPGARCALRKTADDAVDDAAAFGQNYWGRFCACEIQYEPEREPGMMYQCLLGDACHEDWFHDVCLVGRGPVVYGPPDAAASAAPAEAAPPGQGEGGGEDEDEDEEETRATSLGFPKDFEHMICWHCVEANPGLKRYAGLPGFVALPRNTDAAPAAAAAPGQKRKADASDLVTPVEKRARPDEQTMAEGEATAAPAGTSTAVECKLPPLPAALPTSFSLLLPEHFRDELCRCPGCFPLLSRHRVLLEPEEAHKPPLSRSASPTGSILDEGERALNGMDRVRALEGVMAYNTLKDRVKAFLEPFAKSGKAVGADDVKDYFERLKGEGK